MRASPDYRRETVENEGHGARYVYGRVDLNGDGNDEVVVYLMGPFFCGTEGCDLLLFTEADGHSLVSGFPISRTPVTVSPRKTRAGTISFGWNPAAERLPLMSSIRTTARATSSENARPQAMKLPRAHRISPADSPTRTAAPLEPRP
ncbi:MAG TPA: hypothetical protein VLK65_02320 [Vicinamibacteria bacterium]|nr:hypothetical protein [Vicinamibacteria bacterium]